MPVRRLAFPLALLAGASALRAAEPLPPPPAPPVIPGAVAEIGFEPAVAWLVELSEPATAQVFAATLEAGGPASRTRAGAASRTQAQRNRDQQQEVITALRQRARLPDDAVLFSVVRAMNGVAFRVGSVDRALVTSLPGVKAVRAIRPDHLHTAGSVPFIGAPPVWDNSLGLPGPYKGEGIRIAVIDTGIDYLHPAFGGTGLLADYQSARAATANFANAVGFPTAKVIGGHDFVGDAYNGTNAAFPDPNPMDCNGHGSHVAGIAAGYGVKSDGTTFTGPYGTTTPFAALRIGPGVAPAASVYALRVFGCTGTTAFTIPAIDWALDPDGDDDLSDHADVINLSLGSNYGRPNTPSAIAADNAGLLAIVVASAGNAGDSSTVLSAPASGKNVIAVANTTSPQTGPTLNVSGPAGIAGAKTTVVAGWNTTPALPLSADIVAAVPANGCTPLTNGAAIAGKFALIDGGGCNFDVKHNNAVAAGAAATIVVNQVGGLPPTMTGTPANPAVPAVIIGLDAGAEIKSILPATVNATLAMGTAIAGDLLVTTSSRGPVGTFSEGLPLKPDIAAPGYAIRSVQTGVTCGTGGGCITPDASTYRPGGAMLAMSGTSMAAPHVAGVAALIRQRHPFGVIAAHLERLMSATETQILQEVRYRHGPPRVGAGRVSADEVMSRLWYTANLPDSGFDGVFAGDEVAVGNQGRRITLVNESPIPTLDIALDNTGDMSGGSFSAPSSFTPPGGTFYVDVKYDWNAAQIKRGYDVTSVRLDVTGESRPLRAEETAFVKFSHGGQTKASMPIYAELRPAGTLASPLVVQTAVSPPSANGSGTIPYAGQGVCTGTLNGLACTTSPPAPSLGNPRIDFTGITYLFNLAAINPRNQLVDAGANLQYAGISQDTTSIRFGAKTHGNRASARDSRFEVHVDNNLDGTPDRLLVNGFVAVTGSQPSDTPFTFYGPPGGPFNIASYLNGYPAWQFDTPIYDTAVLIHTATPAQLGVTGPFRWWARSCDRQDACDAWLGPFLHNPAAQGFTFGSSAVYQVQSGASIPVTWNAANIAASGSLGVLMLSIHNADGRRSEHVRLPSVTTLSSSAPSVPEGDEVVLTVNTAGVNIAGNVQFREGDRILTSCGSVPLVNGQAQCPSGPLGLGETTFTAHFGGSTLDAPSSGSVAVTATPVAGAHCVTFEDIPRSNPFCRLIEELVNRSVTFGCLSNRYCPDPDVVRMPMAAFMARTPNSLIPSALNSSDELLGPIDLGVPVSMCTSGDIPSASFPRTVNVDTILTGIANDDGVAAVRVEVSTDGGLTWRTIGAPETPFAARPGLWGNQRISGAYDLPAGQSGRTRSTLTRPPGARPILFERLRCWQRTMTFNRDSTHSPFDAAP